MVDERVLVAVGALALLLGVYFLFRRAKVAVKHWGTAAENQKFVERLLKATDRLPNTPRFLDTTGPVRDKATEQTFRNMFSTAADKGEGLIEYYMTRHKCGRAEAMRLAIEAREREDK